MANQVILENVPETLRKRPQWVLWRYLDRDGKQTKVPVQPDGSPAKSNDSKTWTDFETVEKAFDPARFAGVGFVFAPDDGMCGIDLDGCRINDTKRISEWAREIIIKFGSYAEVSPSGAGVKIWCRGVWNSTKHKLEVKHAAVCEKNPAIEVYNSLRYFAVTGSVLRNCKEVVDCQEALDWLREKYFRDEPVRNTPQADFRSDAAVLDRARKYIAKIPGAVSGQGGHNRTFHVACVLALGFELPESDVMGLLLEYNASCVPPWTEKEIAHKVHDAMAQSGARGYLKNAAVGNWEKIPVPEYVSPSPDTTPYVGTSEPEKKEVKTEPSAILTLADSAQKYIDIVAAGKKTLVRTGIYHLDQSYSGGLEFGEMVILAARPSMGKSMVGLQFLHEWTFQNLPCLMISEEMSAIALGKRGLQFMSSIPEHDWALNIERLKVDLATYKAGRNQCYIVENCRTAAMVEKTVDRYVKEFGVRCVVVDYAQLLDSPGKDRYQKITETSIILKRIAATQKVILVVLCQLNRAIESRPDHTPMLSDIRDTGQLEQDADIITFLVWPWRIRPAEPKEKFQFFNAKNRNREIKAPVVVCRLEIARQMVLEALPGEFDVITR